MLSRFICCQPIFVHLERNAIVCKPLTVAAQNKIRCPRPKQIVRLNYSLIYFRYTSILILLNEIRLLLGIANKAKTVDPELKVF